MCLYPHSQGHALMLGKCLGEVGCCPGNGNAMSFAISLNVVVVPSIAAPEISSASLLRTALKNQFVHGTASLGWSWGASLHFRFRSPQPYVHTSLEPKCFCVVCIVYMQEIVGLKKSNLIPFRPSWLCLLLCLLNQLILLLFWTEGFFVSNKSVCCYYLKYLVLYRCSKRCLLCSEGFPTLFQIWNNELGETSNTKEGTEEELQVMNSMCQCICLV